MILAALQELLIALFKMLVLPWFRWLADQFDEAVLACR